MNTEIDDTKEDEEWPEEVIDAIVASVNDWEDIVDEYEPGELELIDADTEEVVDDLKDEIREDTLNEVLSRIERIRAKIRFHKSASKRARKIKIALKRRGSSSTINGRARRLAIKLIKQRILKKPLAQASVADKIRVERIMKRINKVVNRVALRLVVRIRAVEKKRLSRK